MNYLRILIIYVVLTAFWSPVAAQSERAFDVRAEHEISYDITALNNIAHHVIRCNSSASVKGQR
jgi:hypothetical protein